MKTITVRMLRRAGASQSQIDLFRRLFGESAKVTPDNLRDVSDKFDWDWAAENLLSAQLLADYQKKRATLLVDYRSQHITLWTDYERKCATLLAGYEIKRAQLWAECFLRM